MTENMFQLKENQSLQKVVKIADCIISDDLSDSLITYALGSCLGLTVFDKRLKIGVMAHMMLPLSKIDLEKAEKFPFMFVDTGIVKIFKYLFEIGCRKRDLVIKAAGCSEIMDRNDSFSIGKRNMIILRKFLWKNALLLDVSETGGNETRTIILNIKNGKTLIKNGLEIREM